MPAATPDAFDSPNALASATPSNGTIALQMTVPVELGGKRFDQIAAALFPDYSRARLQQWIKSGELTVDGAARQVKDKLIAGAQLALHAQLLPVDASWQPEAIALDIVYEDDDLLVIDKPAGLVVHPAAGHAQGTLLNALINHLPALANVPRAGIVHRLDKDTTGLMVVAKNLTAQANLVEQLQARSVHREYDAVVAGVLISGGTVNAPIGRHPHDRKRQAVFDKQRGVNKERVQGSNIKEAITHYRVVQRFRAHTHIRCLLETGRTHQIRVHMAHIKHSLLGDPVYGARFKIPAGMHPQIIEFARAFPRQALHARKLELLHPRSGELLQWQSSLPADMQELLDYLRDDLVSADE